MKNPFARKPTAVQPLRSCPHCGASMPGKALACPECGSDEHTGWKSEEDIQFESLDLGDNVPEPSSSATRRTAILILAAIFLCTFVFGGMMVWLFSNVGWF